MVIPGVCGDLDSSRSQRLATTYGLAAGYKFGFINYYPISGDVSDWLEAQGIPAIFALTSGYNNTDWSQNRNALEIVLQDVALSD